MNPRPTPSQNGLPPYLHALRTAVTYALLGAVWIVSTDYLLSVFSIGAQAQTLKGWLYVAFTTVGLFLFLRSARRHLMRWQAALIASQQTYAAFISATPDLMFELAPDGTFLDYKPAPMGLNLPPEQFLGRRVQDVMPPIASQTMEALERAFATGDMQIFNYQLPLGEEMHDYEARIVARGKESAIAIVRDITERQRTQEALQRANRAYRMLSDCNQVMVRATGEMALLNDICRIIVSRGQFSMAWVGYARDDEARTLEPVARFGKENGYLQFLQTTWADEPRGRGPSGRAVRTGKPVVVVDCETDPDFEPWREAALERGYRSVAALPLMDAGRVFGVLVVYSDEPNAFRHDEEVDLLAELANDLAYGIIALRTRVERERARQAEREQRLLAEALGDTAITANSTLDLDQVLDRILENIRSVVPHDTASITLLDGDVLRMARHTGFEKYGIADEISAIRFEYRTHEKYHLSMRETHEPLIINDTATSELWVPIEGTEWIRSSIWAPIIYGDELIGVISLDSAQPGFFTQDHAKRLRAFAAHAAVAIRNAQLFTSEHQQRTLAEALSEIAATTIATRDPEAVMERILENLKRVVPYDVANIMLIEEHRARVVRENAPHKPSRVGWLDRLTFDLRHVPLFQRVIETRQALVLSDTAAEPDWQPHPELDWLHAYACAPIVREGQVIGFLNIYNAERGFYTTAHLQHLQAFADQAALALYNAQLFTAERDQRALAEALQDIATIINSTLDVDVVTDRLLDNLKRVLPHDSASLMLIDDEGIGRIVRHRGFVERGLGAWVSQLRLPVESTPTLKRMAETRQPLIISNTATDPEWIPYPQIAWIRSYVGAPIHREGRVFGYLQVESAWPNFFNEEHAHRLQSFADQAAIALQNAQLFQDVQQQATALQVQAQKLALVNRVSTHVAHHLDLEAIYRTVLLELQDALGASFGGLVMFENDKVGRLVLGTHPDDDANHNVTISLENNLSIEHVRATHKPLVSEDVLNDPFFEPAWPALRMRGTRTLIIMPLIVGNDVIGTLGLDWVEPRQFTADELELVETIANQASVAITKARLYVAEREQRVLAEALGHVASLSNRSLALDDLYDELLESIRRVIAYDAGNILLFEGDVGEVVRHTGYDRYSQGEKPAWMRLTPDQVPHWSRLYAGGHPQPYIIADTHADPEWADIEGANWIRCALKAPISIENRVIGLLNLDSATPNSFTQRDAERLQAFADQVALAIQNARLFQAEREQRTLAEALRSAAAAVSSTLQIDTVLDRILANVGQVLPHDAANIMLIEDGVARVARGYGYAEHGAGTWISQLRFKVDEIPVWQEMLATRRPFAVPDTHRDPNWLRLVHEEWIRSTVKAPIVLENQVIGILHLDSTQPGFFNDEDAERLQAFADQAAIAIRNAQLYDAIQLHASELEQRVSERTAELEAQRAQLQAILDSMGEAVLFSRGPNVLYVNEAFTELLGYTAEDLTRQRFTLPDSLLAPGQDLTRLHNAIRKGLAQGRSWRGEVEAQRRDSTTFNGALTITPVPSLDSSEGSAFVAILRDISQEKALQAQKDRFIAHASHELRTPLANVKTRLYLLRKQPEKLAAHLDVLNRVTDSMAELIENLLDVSRFERGVIPLYRRPVALCELVDEVIAIQRPEAERKNILLHALLPDEPLMIEADPQRMNQVITNLVINAINYTPEGGTISIEVEQLQPSEDAPHGQVAIHVRDTGIGIPSEMLSQVFDPFFRTNEEVAPGTGLGLTIAREIVHLHHGTIEVASEVNAGTVFTVTLDLIDEQEQSEPVMYE